MELGEERILEKIESCTWWIFCLCFEACILGSILAEKSFSQKYMHAEPSEGTRVKSFCVVKHSTDMQLSIAYVLSLLTENDFNLLSRESNNVYNIVYFLS
jgi:hypothetical protein